MWRVDSLEKTLMLGGIGGQEEKGTTKDEMAGWHQRLYGHEFEWTPGVGDGQGGLVCCDSWSRKESDMSERLNWTSKFGRNSAFMRMHSATCHKNPSWASLNIQENYPNNIVLSSNLSTGLLYDFRIKLDKWIPYYYFSQSLFVPPIFASLIFLAPLSSTEKEWLHIPIAQIYHPYPLWSGGKVFTIPRRKGVRKTKYLAVHDWDNTS